MDAVIPFLVRHGAAVLFAAVLAEQAGLPLPAIPLLLAAGALAASGKMSLWLAIGLPVVASLPGDLVWYALGRRSGSRALSLLCRISLEPDSCVRRTEDVFARHGVTSLLVAKLVPGLSTVTPPLAGMFRVSLPRFLLYDALGALFWAEVFVGLGSLFSGQLERLAASAARMGATAGALLVGAGAGYVLFKCVQRECVLRRLRVARITADELRRMLAAGEEVFIVDLRHGMDAAAEPYVIPGALRMTPEELDRRHPEIPRTRDIVLYCS